MTKEDLLVLAAEKYDKLQEINQVDDFYRCEKAFDNIWLEFSR